MKASELAERAQGKTRTLCKMRASEVRNKLQGETRKHYKTKTSELNEQATACYKERLELSTKRKESKRAKWLSE